MSARVSLALIEDAVAGLERLAPFLSPIEHIKLNSLKKNIDPIRAYEIEKSACRDAWRNGTDVVDLLCQTQIAIQRMGALKGRTSRLLERSRDALATSRALLCRIENR